MAGERPSERLERSRRLRESVAETLRKVRRTHEDLAERDPPPPTPAPLPESGAAPGDRPSGGLLPDVSAVVDRARAVIERTKRVLEETRKHVGGRVRSAGEALDPEDADRNEDDAEDSAER